VLAPFLSMFTTLLLRGDDSCSRISLVFLASRLVQRSRKSPLPPNLLRRSPGAPLLSSMTCAAEQAIEASPLRLQARLGSRVQQTRLQRHRPTHRRRFPEMGLRTSRTSCTREGRYHFHGCRSSCTGGICGTKSFASRRRGFAEAPGALEGLLRDLHSENVGFHTVFVS
jgi:hypothetical protein